MCPGFPVYDTVNGHWCHKKAISQLKLCKFITDPKLSNLFNERLTQDRFRVVFSSFKSTFTNCIVNIIKSFTKPKMSWIHASSIVTVRAVVEHAKFIRYLSNRYFPTYTVRQFITAIYHQSTISCAIKFPLPYPATIRFFNVGPKAQMDGVLARLRAMIRRFSANQIRGFPIEGFPTRRALEFHRDTSIATSFWVVKL